MMPFEGLWVAKKAKEIMDGKMTHFGDPCIHCGTPHDDVEPGACKGDPKKAKPIAYCSMGVRWDNVEHFRVRYSDGRIEDRWDHISSNVHYYHFGHSQTLQHPPRYDEKLRSAR